MGVKRPAADQPAAPADQLVAPAGTTCMTVYSDGKVIMCLYAAGELGIIRLKEYVVIIT
jgi:hypothetical protein